MSVIALQNYLIAPPSIQPALIGLNTDAVVKCVISSLTSMYSKRHLVLFSDELQWVMRVQQQERDMCVFGVRLWLLCRGCSSQRCFQRKHSYFSSRHVYISVVESLTFLFLLFSASLISESLKYQTFLQSARNTDAVRRRNNIEERETRHTGREKGRERERGREFSDRYIDCAREL